MCRGKDTEAVGMSGGQLTIVTTVCEGLRPPPLATGVSRALRARRVSGSVLESAPENLGVSGSVPRSVSRALQAPAPECPKSVPRVSPECRVWDIFSTLRGHSRDNSGARGPRRAPETLRGTLPETPRVSGTLSGTLPETLRA